MTWNAGDRKQTTFPKKTGLLKPVRITDHLFSRRESADDGIKGDFDHPLTVNNRKNYQGSLNFLKNKDSFLSGEL